MKFKFSKTAFPLAFISLLLVSEQTVDAQIIEDARPRLSRNDNNAVTSGASIELKIVYSKDGFDPIIQPAFFFLQGKKRLTAATAGGVGILETATQLFNIAVPDGLSSGTCQVLAQFGDFETQPISLEVTA